MITMEKREPTVEDLKPGMFLVHFKHWLDESYFQNNRYLYQVLHIAQHTETGEKMMVYQALYAPFKVYCRPVSMVFEPVDTVKYSRATQKHRFEIVGEYDGFDL